MCSVSTRSSRRSTLDIEQRGPAADLSTTPASLMRRFPVSLMLGLVAFGAACGGDSSSATGPDNQLNSCPAASSQSNAMTVLGCGDFKPKRITGEINVHGTTAYTTTWNNASPTSAFYVWDVAGNVPKLVDSVMVDGASTLGDVVVTPDGKYLVVATEYARRLDRDLQPDRSTQAAARVAVHERGDHTPACIRPKSVW